MVAPYQPAPWAMPQPQWSLQPPPAAAPSLWDQAQMAQMQPAWLQPGAAQQPTATIAPQTQSQNYPVQVPVWAQGTGQTPPWAQPLTGQANGAGEWLPNNGRWVYSQAAPDLPPPGTGLSNPNTAMTALYNQPGARTGMGADQPGQVGKTPVVGSTGLNPNRTVTSGAGNGWRIQNGRLTFDLSGHPEGVNARILRKMSDMMRGGMDERTAYDRAVADLYGGINAAGAADSTFKILPYETFTHMAGLLAQQGGKVEGLWGKGFDDRLSYINNTDYGQGQTGDTYERGGTAPVVGTPPTVPTATPPASTGGAPPGSESQDPGATPTAPPAGGTQPQTKYFGQFGTDDLATMLQAAAADPDRAAQILRLARGQQGRPLGRLADFRDDLYGRAFQTALSLSGMGQFGGMEGQAQNFLQNAVLNNNLAGYGSDLGRKVANTDFTGMDSRTMEQALRAGLAMQGINMGSLGGAVQSGRLEDIIYQDWARNLANSGNDTRNFSDLLQNSPFLQAMRNFR